MVLIGYRGAGKTTIGQTLAARLGVPFVDTDLLVESHAGASVAEVFEERGEGEFRRLEREVVLALEPAPRRVIAAGGGAVMDPDCRAHFLGLGTVVWLEAPAAVLGQRIAGSGRPSLTGRPAEAEVAAVLAAREPTYRAMASHVQPTEGKTPEEVCNELQRLW